MCRRNRDTGAGKRSSGKASLRGFSAFRKAVLLGIVLTLVLSGCSSAGSSNGKSTSSAANASTAASAEAASADPGTPGESPVGTNDPDTDVPESAEKSADAAAQNGTAGDGREEKDGKALTLMLYLCGSDLESKAGAATSDLDEILASGVDAEAVNIVVMAGGTTKWQNGFSEEEAAVYALKTGADGSPAWEKVQTFSSPEQEDAPANMGEEESLRQFLDYGHEQYPAQKYALIMWDHGGGPMRGLCWDTAWAKDNLTMEEFTGALAASPFAGEKLSWIGFDACLMSSVETAHLVSPYADYMIASEETEPSLGWSYDFLKEIEKDADGAATGKRIVDAFFAAAEAEKVESALTLSCTDLTKIQAVEQGLDGFFGVLSDSLDAENFSELSNLRQDTREFGKAMNDSQRMDLVDLGDLVAHYSEGAPAEAETLKKALEDTVVYNRSSLENCTGLSAYHPYYNKTYYEKVWQKEYDSFEFAPSYTDYINDFAKIWMDDAMGDWTQMSRVQSAGAEQDVQYFSVQLTPEQLQYYASSQLLILSTIGSADDPSGIAYSQVYITGDVSVDENGLLTASYNGRTLYALDDRGEAITGPLRYEISDDGNLQIFANYVNEEGGDSQRLVHAMFECADNPDGGDLQILDQYIYDEEADVWSNRLQIAQEDYQEMLLLNDYKEMTYDSERILPFSLWKDSGWMGGYEVSLPESIHFRFFDRNLEGEDLFACFQISDTQANMYGTELMRVENTDVTTVLFEGGSPEDRTPGLDPGLQTITGGQGSFEENTPGENSSQGQDQGQADTEPAAAGGSVYTLENEQLRMTVQAEINHSENAKYVKFTQRYENLSGGTLILTPPNGIELSDGSRKCICFPGRGNIGLYLKPGESETRTAWFYPASLGMLSDVQQIRIVMNGTVETEEPAGESSGEDSGAGTTAAAAPETQKSEVEVEAVLHPTNLDLSLISKKAKAREEDCVLAEAARGDLHWELLDIEQDRKGDVYQEYLIRNEGKETVTMQVPDGIAINGVALDSPYILFQESVTIGPGMECCLSIYAEDRQYILGYYDNMSGSQHLAVSDVLYSEGVENIRTISLLPEDQVFGWSEQEADLQETPLQFDLKKAFPLRQKAGVSASAEEENAEKEKASEFSAGADEADPGDENAQGEEDDLTPEAMTRALDAGGKSPSRTKLFSEDGITVYGEHLLIADCTLLMTLIVENESEENTVLRFYNWEAGSGESQSFDTGCISFAGTRKRIYLDPTFDMGEEPDPASDQLKEASVCIWKDGKMSTAGTGGAQEEQTETGAGNPDGASTTQTPGLPSVYRIIVSFADGTAFNQEGGISLAFDEVGINPVCLTENKEKGNIFDPSVSCPEDPAQYKRKITFTLPDTLTEEQRSHVTDVLVGVQRDCHDQMTPEAQEKAETCLQSLSWIPMEQNADQPDTFSANYAGLVCVLKDDHTIAFSTTEDSSSDKGTGYAMLGSGSLSTWRILTEPQIYNSRFGYGYTFRIRLDNEKESGELSDFTISDENKSMPVSNWPASWFHSLDFEMGAPAYTRREDGTLDYQTMGISVENKSLPLEGKPVPLEMIPVTEYSPDIVLLYSVQFDDGSSMYIEGGKY